MYEDNKKTSITSFFIKLIIVIIFVIFALWLLSSINKGLNSNIDNINNSLNVLTDNIFSENINKMKEVGKEYFTTERLPQNIGDVKSLTLKEMYDKKLILELKDKNGKTCSADNSYVMVEKLDSEYQMKVYLECGEEKNYIIVIMGCYDYCSTTICERNNDSNDNTIINNNHIEYEYKKTTGGYWTDFGSWSEWSRIEINKTNYRDVETKTEKEKYTYDKTIYKNEYIDYVTNCPTGYTKTSDGTKCYKVVKTTQNATPVCPATYNGYALASQNGFECKYTLTTTTTSEPVCASKYGNGTYTSISNFTCYYKVSGECQKVAYQELVNTYCGTIICGQHYETKYKTVCSADKIISTPATCKEGYQNINGICTLTSTNNMTVRNATCPSGYTEKNNTCEKEIQENKYTELNKSCPAGYEFTKDKSKCYKEVSSVIKATGTKQVTYYRYRTRQYIGGSVDIKWSRSNNDASLLNAGYKLTGNTKTVSGK